jgi:hypothetical protein
VALLADNDVIVNDDAERLGRGDDLLLDIGAEGGRVPRRVIVHQHDGGGRQIERPFHHLADIDRCVVHGALLLYFVGDDLIAPSRNRMRNCSLLSKPIEARQ